MYIIFIELFNNECSQTALDNVSAYMINMLHQSEMSLEEKNKLAL